MFKQIIRYSIIFFFILTVNCIGSTIITPVDAFLKKHPDLKNKYKELYPTSCKKIIDSINTDYSSKISLLWRIKNKFLDVNGLEDYLNSIEDLETKIANDTIDNYEKIKKIMTKDDYLYYFTYEDNKVNESGILILRNGDIKYREVSIIVENKK